MIEVITINFEKAYAPGIKNIRNAVFTNEQNIDPDIDFDGQDENAVHVLVICKSQYVATGRMLQDGHIGRLAVLKKYRARGLGAKVVLSLIQEAKNRDMKRVYLGAQKHAVGFYKKLGFSIYGKPYREANIDHLHMEKNI